MRAEALAEILTCYNCINVLFAVLGAKRLLPQDANGSYSQASTTFLP